MFFRGWQKVIINTPNGTVEGIAPVIISASRATVKELLNHKSLTMTLRYAHLAPSHRVKAVGVLDEVVNN